MLSFALSLSFVLFVLSPFVSLVLFAVLLVFVVLLLLAEDMVWRVKKIVQRIVSRIFVVSSAAKIKAVHLKKKVSISNGRFQKRSANGSLAELNF